jgi:energy-coupling factor transport system permease protein
VIGVLEPVRTGPLARRNPTAKLLAATAPAVGLVASLDAVTPALVLVWLLGAVPLSGVPVGLLVRRARPVLVAAVAVAVLNALLTDRRSGAVLLDVGPVELTSGAAITGLGIGLRVLALALPGVLVLAATDPVDLADSLVQQARLPARFAYGTLAALRLLPLLGDQWRTLARARRARGVDAGRSPAALLRLFASQVLGLLVVAIRRGTRLATAMDARGFDAEAPRTTARPQTVGPADVALVLTAVAVTAGAVAVSVALGTWRPLVGA